MIMLESRLRQLIRHALLESGVAYGPNYQTLDNDPLSWEDYPGINVEHYADPGTGYYVQVECEVDPSLSTPLRLFATEEDAMNFARQHTMQIQRKLMSRGDIPAKAIDIITLDSANYQSNDPDPMSFPI